MSWLLRPVSVLLLLGAALAAPARAAEKDAIQRAVARGVEYLKRNQAVDGSWPHINAGATALAGLTLLECGVPAEDPVIQRAAAFVRQASVGATHTYSVSLFILFLDRLGDSREVPLLESLSVRLLAGQSPQGGWSYQCPTPSEEEVRRLGAHLQQQAELVARREAVKPAAKRTVEELPKEVKDELARLANRQMGAGFGIPQQPWALLQRDDNSNTQFALLALWVSRRHGLPVDAALTRAERHFRQTQNADGGWSYLPVSGGGQGLRFSTPAMTCAGLLALAMGYGANGEAVLRTGSPKPPGKAKANRNLATDRAVAAALGLLSTAIGQPRGRLPGLGNLDRTVVDYYYLWSLERVAMLYGLKTIGKKDWYAWGAELLVELQGADGNWIGKYAAGGVDTCFALLFLNRSNLAQDLTASLRGKLSDAEVQLRSKGFPKEEATSPSVKVSPQPVVPPRGVSPLPATSGLVPTPGVREPEPQVQRLSESLVRAPAARREAVLTELVESKGPVYTEALAAAIPHLSGEVKQQARDGLARRLARMTPATLREKFKEENAEVRRAAALAVELKGERPLIPELIALLEDADRGVGRAAHAALKEMARQDFGPTATANAAERAQAIARWKAWWASEK